MFADKEIQRRVSFREFGSALQLGNALRDLFVFEQHKTFVDKLFENLLVREVRAREYARAQFVAMNVLFLLERVALATFAPHPFESLSFDDAVFSKQTDERANQRAIEVGVLRVTQKQIE